MAESGGGSGELSDRRPRAGRRGAWGRQRKKTERVAEGLPRRRQRECLPGRVSPLGESGRWKTISSRQDAKGMRGQKKLETRNPIFATNPNDQNAENSKPAHFRFRFSDFGFECFVCLGFRVSDCEFLNKEHKHDSTNRVTH